MVGRRMVYFSPLVSIDSSAARRTFLLLAFNCVKMAVVLMKTARWSPASLAAQTIEFACPKPREATLTRASAPCIEVDKAWVSETSPSVHSISGCGSTERSLPGRYRQRTSYPFFNKSGTTQVPVNPVPPVTKTFMHVPGAQAALTSRPACHGDRGVSPDTPAHSLPSA